jgi:HK97 family phage prohead protease
VKLRILTPKFQEPFAIKIAMGGSARAAALPEKLPTIIIHKAAASASEDFSNVKRFHADVELELDAKKVESIKDGEGNIIDYRNVRLTGYLSTFKHVTESDRQGDYVEAGAFRDTLKRFMQNPVMLTDHRNSVANLAGTFTDMKEDKNGLRFEALLSNAPGNIDVRFKVAEGMLRTTSMGGIFHYKEDGRGIFKVDLWEGSLTPIPANPDARFSVRDLDDTDRKYLRTAHKFASYYHFLEAEGLLGETMRK